MLCAEVYADNNRANGVVACVGFEHLGKPLYVSAIKLEYLILTFIINKLFHVHKINLEFFYLDFFLDYHSKTI